MLWDYTSTQRQARELISGDSPAAKTKLLFFNRTQSSAVASLLTGHNTLRRLIYIMGLIGRPLFRRHGAQNETSAHVLCECGTLVTLRHTHLASFFLDFQYVKNLSLGSVWHFHKWTGLPWIGLQSKAGLTILWLSERFPWHSTLAAAPHQRHFIVKNVCICIHTHCDSVEAAYALTLLSNNTASETFLHKPEAVRIADWKYIPRVPAWKWLREYVTLDKMFYNLFFKQKVIAAPVTSIFSSLSHSSNRPSLDI